MKRVFRWVSAMALCAGLISVSSVQVWSHGITAASLGRKVNVISLADTLAEGTQGELALGKTEGIPEVSIYAGEPEVTRQEVANVSQIVQGVVSRILKEDLGSLPRVDTSVVLFATRQGYARAVQKSFPANETTRVTQQTGGFTSGSVVYVPLYKYQDSAFLANTLAHELTHAQLNGAHIGGYLPTWIDEGFAWYNGVQAQTVIDSRSVDSMNAVLLKEMASAHKKGSFLPLSTEPSSVLLANAGYNVEFQDYLAVQALIAGYGTQQFDAFLRDVPSLGLDSSFQKHYGFGLHHYMSSVNQLV